MDFFLEGGIPGFVTLALGFAAVATGARFAHRPHERSVGVVRCLSAAVVFLVLASLASTLRAVFQHVPARAAGGEDLAPLVLVGLGEALMPAIVGFGLLGLAWMLFALGARRLPSF